MSSTNKTANYALPQWIGTDKPTFLGDLNGAFDTIDAKLYDAITTSSTANETVKNTSGELYSLKEQVTTNTGSISTNTSSITTLQNLINAIMAGTTAVPVIVE